MVRARWVPAAALVAGVGLAAAGWAPVRAQGVLPLVESFDTVVEGVPPGWANDSVGELRVSTVADPRRPREGSGAWRVVSHAWHAGFAQVRRTGIRLERGQSYSLEVWLRGSLPGPVTVSLRRAGAAGAVYFSREFAVGPEWRRAVLTGRAPETDGNAVLNVAFSGTGEVSLDALRLVAGELPVEPAPAPPAARPGNRIYNSSFELGLDGWAIPEQIALVREEAPDGKQFARWLPGAYPLEARPFLARPNQKYVISAHLRSQRPGAQVEVAAVEVGSGTRIASKFDLTPQWRRYTFTAELPCGAYPRYFLSFAPAAAEHGFDLDAVQVEEGELSPHAAAAALEVSPGLGRQALFPRPDETVGVPIQLHAAGGAPAEAAVQIRLEGFRGETLLLQRLPARAGEVLQEIPARVRMPGAGLVRLIVEALAGREVVSRAEALLTVLPALDPRPNPDSFFGAHGSLGTPGEWHAPTIAARAGVRWWRLHDLSAYTQWSVAQPEPDRFVWYDREIDALRSRGLSILGVLARTPEWAGQDPGGAASPSTAWPPARIGDLARYVREVTTHYRGRIAAYEIWNEPWAREFWAGTPEKYAELVKAAAPAARQGDPKATLVGGCFFVPRPQFTDRVLARGVTGVVDAISHHHYTQPEHVAFTYGGRDQVTQWSRTLRGKLDLVGGRNRPLWNTEGGTPCPSFYSWLGAEEQARAAARTLAKTLVLNRASGVRRYFYYHVWQEIGGPRLFDWLHTNNWALLDHDGAGKPTLAALAACARRLEGAELLSRVETPALKAFVFRKGAGAVVALWSPAALERTRDLTLKGHLWRARAYDVVGGPLGLRAGNGTITLAVRNEPAYLEIADTDAARVAVALKAAAVAPLWQNP